MTRLEVADHIVVNIPGCGLTREGFCCPSAFSMLTREA